jgi:hypothetical protein
MRSGFGVLDISTHEVRTCNGLEGQSRASWGVRSNARQMLGITERSSTKYIAQLFCEVFIILIFTACDYIAIQ